MTASTLADNLRFLRALVARPKNVGAVFPSGPALARAIARQIDPLQDGPVLELGPGTGVVTAAILERGVAPERLTLVEFDENFARHNTARFPGVHVIQGDAFNLEHTLLGRPHLPFCAIVSGLPLLNFPVAMRRRLMDGVLTRLAPGAPFIQFSYGTQAPVAPPPGFRVTRAAMVWINIPPARVWVYRRA
ncbi:MAG: Ribose transporter permease [Alphaproteobacteria bacterium]|nr:Ribose transporter permease [Alphaproteobacteria bacterium]